MRRTRSRLAALALLALGGVAGVLLAAPDVTAVPTPDAVLVVNGSDQPVPTSIVGTPTVNVAGTPTVSLAGTPTVNVGGTVSVQPARLPYQAFVTISSSGGEDCEAIAIPEGKRVWIESFSADAFGASEPAIYVRVDASTGGGTSFVRPVTLDLEPSLTGGWAGHSELLLHAGSPAPGPRSFTIHACIFPPSGSSASGRAFVSGWMENA